MLGHETLWERNRVKKEFNLLSISTKSNADTVGVAATGGESQ